MRIALWTVPFVLIITFVLGLRICSAQVVSAVRSAPTPSIGGCTGLPYSATQTQTNIKTNADGTTTEHKDVHLVWRDADGRTRDELVFKPRSDDNSLEHSVIVYEPVKRAWWSWSYGVRVSRKVVWVRHFRDQDGPAFCPRPPSPQTKRNPGDLTLEFLPPTTINGISVVHTRNFKVLPAGTYGIDHEFTIAHEWWISPELGVIMRHTHDDPRSPKIIVELSDVKRVTPDPALFQVPEGYQMQDVPPPAPSALGKMLQDFKPVLPPPPPK
jgi:hypothetical protein